MSGINFAMDKCDEGHSEWKGWWGALAGIHMLIGLVFLLAPTNIIPYQGESLLPGLYQPSPGKPCLTLLHGYGNTTEPSTFVALGHDVQVC